MSCIARRLTRSAMASMTTDARRIAPTMRPISGAQEGKVHGLFGSKGLRLRRRLGLNAARTNLSKPFRWFECCPVSS